MRKTMSHLKLFFLSNEAQKPIWKQNVRLRYIGGTPSLEAGRSHAYQLVTIHHCVQVLRSRNTTQTLERLHHKATAALVLLPAVKMVVRALLPPEGPGQKLTATVASIYERLAYAQGSICVISSKTVLLI